jgi:predicted transposase YdaD
MDHDRLFKELLTTFFADFLDLFLPELSADLDRTAIEFLDKEVFTDVTAGAKHEADLVAKARFRGQESFFIVHLEHQAQPQVEFARRMFGYFAALHARHQLPVYPSALFSHASRQPEPEEYRVAFPDLEVLHFRYRVIQLSRLNWRDFVRQANPVASALMARMGMAVEDRPRVKLECLRLLATLRLDKARLRLISGFIDSYLRLSQPEGLIFTQEAASLLSATEQSKVMELTTSWKEEGMEIGRQEGRQEGLQREQQFILRLLKRRFGDLAPELESAIGQLPVDRLEELGEAYVDFPSIADLKRWLSPR